MEETGSRISVPPPSVDKDEIVVSGEKDGVRVAIDRIMAVYEEKVSVVVLIHPLRRWSSLRRVIFL